MKSKRIALLLLATALVATPATAQRGGKSKQDPALKPRPVALQTKDGAELNAFYFPSEKGKEAVPVLILHEWKGQAGPYGRLCLALREAGFAVLALEYRGHGKSRSYIDPRTQKSEPFDLATMGKREVEAIVTFDLEEAKQFLKNENNEGRLNLNALSVIGVQEGAIMAMHWAVRDWRWPSVGRKKQGQDVKSLVLISPEKNHLGLSIDATLRDVNVISLPIMILVGSESPQGSESERLGNRIEAFKKRANQGSVVGFEANILPTNLTGGALLAEVPTAIPSIVTFLTSNVPVSETQNPWVERL